MNEMEKIKNIAKLLQTQVVQEQMEGEKANLALNILYSLKKAAEFNYEPQKTPMTCTTLNRLLKKIEKGEKLLNEDWTAEYFFKAAQVGLRKLDSKISIPKTVSEAISNLENFIQSK